MPFFLAAPVPEFLPQIVALIGIAAVVAYVCQRLGLVPIVGFLLAGVLIGPHALGLITDEAVIEAAAEIGVLLLLFTIGIEFSLEKLAKITRLIFVGGGLQVGLVTAAVTGLLLLFGVDWHIGVFSGFLAALSSTAIVLKLLGDRGETNTAPGQSAVGVLIFQDLAVIVMVLLVPALGGEGGSALDVGWALTKAALIIALVLVVARRVMPPILEAVARTCSPELFLLTVIAICFGTAYLVGLAGVSIALGAFLAGLVVSESTFSEHAFSEILPLQILFSATFFVSVGLLLNVGYMLTNLPLVLAVIGVVLVLKLATTFIAVRAVGRAVPVAAATALILAQVGEFSFVLERAGREVGLTPMGMGEAGSQSFIAATVILMALTPVFAPYAGRLARKLETRMGERAMTDEPEPSGDEFAALENHVIVAGYGAAARKLVRVLRGSGIPFVIATLSPDGAREAERDGLPVLRGDYAKRHILEMLGLERAKLLVIPDDNPQMAHRVTAVARSLSPTTRILTCAMSPEEAEELEAAGADRVIAAELETLVGFFDDILRRYEIEPGEILAHEEALRRGNYAVFDRTPDDAPMIECELDDDCFATRTLTLREGMPVAGKTLADLQLDERLLHVLHIEHDGERLDEPTGDTVLSAGATVTFGGHTDSFIAAADLFRIHDLKVPLPDLPAPSAMRADWIDTTQPVSLIPNPNAGCTHTDHIHEVTPSAQGCEECLQHGDRWVHLRICMECGHVGCCDSSPGKHATAHYHATGHPVMRSIERGERWGWCYVDEAML
ncbi:MAG: sodium:proton exchanger [Rhodothermaceae bacterium]|nr:sodium:proton exchanger [Rhodothermaceae bacterium]